MLTIVNDQIIFNDIMVNGEEQLVEWIVIADSNALLGDIPFNIHFAANAGDVNYENNVEFHLPLSYGLFGYPIEGVNIKTSPILSDLDGNSLNEIYFASDSTLHGKWVGGFDVPGFPLTIESTISSSIAVGDLEGDGDNEIIFGSFAGVLHALDKTGTEIMSYLQDKPIIDFPVLSDLDQDGDLEIVFISVNDTASSLFVIDHNGEDIDGFPIEINERLIVGPAVADLDNDMTMDIVVTTLDSNIYVVNGSGVINDEFPIISSSGFTTPATLVDLDGDQDLEILAGTESGDIYMYHHDGTTMNFLSFGSPIIGGISIADIDADGNFEIIFGTQNGHMHAWDPIEDAAASGWPVQSEQGAISEPITVDLDNDGDLEIVYSTINGGVAIIHHDGNTYDNFPSTLAENIFSTPTIGDLDNDGDFELIIGTSSSLQVVDIEEQKGDKFAWSVYRSNNHRNGYFDITLASIIENESNLPIQYSLGRNYPNPFNPRTTFSYSIPKRDKVTISIYDMKGRIVKTLLNNQQSSGSRSISWNATNHLGIKVSSGVYFYRMQAGRFSQTNKMVLLK